MDFTAKKTSKYSYKVRENSMLSGCFFGDVSLCDAYGTSLWVFVARQGYEEINEYVEANESLEDVFADIRNGYEIVTKNWDSEARAEQLAEGAWLRAAEYNPEHQDEMCREDAMGLS